MTDLTVSALAVEADRKSARKFFMAWLVVSTLLTMIGNAVVPVLGLGPSSATAPLAVVVIAHLIPPLTALLAVHSVIVFSRIGGLRREKRAGLRGFGILTIVVTTLIGILSLALSFNGLYALALASGWHGFLAVCFPLIIDLGVVVSTASLVALRPLTEADRREAMALHPLTNADHGTDTVTGDNSQVVALPPVPSQRRSSYAERRKLRLAAATIEGQEPTAALIRELRNSTCVYCASPADHADHVRPIARGGWHHERNLVPACATCNTTRNASLLVEWMSCEWEKVVGAAARSEKVAEELFHEMCALDNLLIADPLGDAPYRRTGPSPYLGSPLPPIYSPITEPDINSKKAQQWAAISRSKASKTTYDPSPVLAPVSDPEPVSDEMMLALRLTEGTDVAPDVVSAMLTAKDAKGAAEALGFSRRTLYRRIEKVRQEAA